MATIRVATQNDALGIAEVQVAGWKTGYRGLMPDAVLANLSVPKREGMWRRIIAESKFELVIAEANATIVGFVNFGPSRDPDATATATGEVLAIYVHPTHWHDGVGQTLMQATLSKLKSAGFKEVTLWVLDSMARTRGFYERQGFVVDGATKQETVGEGAATINEIRYRQFLCEQKN
jgi:L-amino acid N-acyltransferase YncA